jgi:hypothetical protein
MNDDKKPQEDERPRNPFVKRITDLEGYKPRDPDVFAALFDGKKVEIIEEEKKSG